MEQPIDIYRTGVEIERMGIERYLDYAFKTKDATGKNMFIRLAGDELSHLNTLEKQLNDLRCGSVLSCAEIPASLIEKVVPAIRTADRIRSDQGSDELGALKTALEMERKSIDFYNAARTKVRDPEAVKTFERIIVMEESHYDLIQSEIDHIESTGFWFGIREFTLEEER